MGTKSVNQKQSLFIAEYLVDQNATQAAIRAGYSPKTAYSQGQRLLKNVEIQKAIQDQMQKRSKRIELSQDTVLRGIADIAFGNSRNTEKLKALELLARHLGLFERPKYDNTDDVFEEAIREFAQENAVKYGTQ